MSEATLPVVAQKQSPIFVMAERFSIEPSKLMDVLRGTVIKPDSKTGRQASNEEVAAFVIVANQYQLNPFTREIHAFVGRGGNLVPIVGIDGWVSLVNRHKDYDGCNFQEKTSTDGTPLSTTCTMYSKARRHPVQITEWFSECRRDTEPWRTMPRRMLRHKAYIQAARVCFGLTGVYDEEEGAVIADNGYAAVIDQRPAVKTGMRPAPGTFKLDEDAEPGQEQAAHAFLRGTGPKQSAPAPEAPTPPPANAAGPSGKVMRDTEPTAGGTLPLPGAAPEPARESQGGGASMESWVLDCVQVIEEGIDQATDTRQMMEPGGLLEKNQAALGAEYGRLKMKFQAKYNQLQAGKGKRDRRV